MRKFVFIFSLLSLVGSMRMGNAIDVHVNKADEITYEWLRTLGDATGYSDHVAHFRKIFETYKVKTLIEFGVGYSTKYFLDNCNKVISVEFVTLGCGPDWIKKCLDLYQDFSNWTAISYFSAYQWDTNWAPYKFMGSNAVHVAATYQMENHRSYAPIDDLYLYEINSFYSKLAKIDAIDLAFIDAGIHIRGDLVQLSFGKVPIIVAHDAGCRIRGDKNDCYGYGNIITPQDYEEIHIKYGKGTAVWISKKAEYKELLLEIKKYADNFSRS